MTDDQLLRYSRHLLLEEIGIEGQERVLKARVLLVGAGGLGCAAALYLASAGCGHITVVDHDTVDLTNLQRQIAHTTARVGQFKVDSLHAALAGVNPDVVVRPMARRGDPTLLDELLPEMDLVLDCTDNFTTRHMINAACVTHRTPLVCGAAIQFDGQITVFDPRQPESPCYACMFPPQEMPREAHCATMGVFAPLVGIIGSMQAAEALKLLSSIGKPLAGQLWMLDARTMSNECIRVARNTACTVCGSAE